MDAFLEEVILVVFQQSLILYLELGILANNKCWKIDILLLEFLGSFVTCESFITSLICGDLGCMWVVAHNV